MTKAQRRRIRRQQTMMKLFAVGMLVLCVAAVALMPLINTTPIRKNAKPSQDTWYVEGGDMQIAAVERNTSQNVRDMREEIVEAPAATVRPLVTPQPTVEATAPVAPAVTPLPTLPSFNFEIEVTQAPFMDEIEFEEDLSSLPFVETVQRQPAPTLPVQAVMVDVYATPKPQGIITVTAVGDCTLGGEAKSGGYGEKRFDEYVERYGYDYFLKNVRDIFEEDDLTIINLEGPLTTSTDVRDDRKFNFRGSPDYVNILTGSGVDVCNLANNHAFDFGQEGFDETHETLRNAGIGASGFGLEYYTEVNGYTVGSIGFTEWDYETDEILDAVAAAREKCDLLLVSMHWGKELDYEPNRTVVNLGHKIVDAGADLVIGTHSHVYGRVEQYKGKYIVYSLGNFCFGGNGDPEDKNTTIFQQTFHITANGVEDAGINIIPAYVTSVEEYNNFQPVVLSGETGNRLINKVSKISKIPNEDVLWSQDSYVLANALVTPTATARVMAES